MNLFAKQSPIFCVLLSSVMISACSEDEAAAILDEIVPPETAEVSVDFAAQVNGADFACGDTYTGIGTGGDDYKVTDFRMYVHDAHIKDPLTSEKHAIELTQDGVWQRDDVALLDFEDGCDTGTPESTLRFPSFIFSSSQFSRTSPASFTLRSPKTWGCLNTSLSQIPSSTSAT